MNMIAPDSRSGHQDRPWLRILARYRQPNRYRSAVELAITVAPLAILWALCWLSLEYEFWLGLVLIVPAAGFMVRLFMIQHDCGHGSFFAHRRTDDWIGRVLGVLT